MLKNFINHTTQNQKISAESRKAKQQPVEISSAACATDEKEALGIDKYIGMEQSGAIGEQHCRAIPVHYIESLT